MKKLRHAAKIVVRRRSDGKYLMLWSSKWEGNPARSQKPDLPGGLIEEGESLTDGLLREMDEEVGFAAKESDLVLAHAHVWDEGNTSTVFLVYFTEVQETDVTLSWEHERYAWLDAEEILALEIRKPYPTIFQHMNEVGLLV